MSPRDSRCPACAHATPASETHCGACGLLLADDNLCERCHALAPAIDVGTTLACSACHAPRPRLPRTVVATSDELSEALEVGWLMRATLPAICSLGGALGLALAAPFMESDGARQLALGLSGAALVAAAACGWFVVRERAVRCARRRFELLQRVVGLAYQRDGVLGSEHVAHALSVSASEAESLLSEHVQAGRASVEVRAEGHLVYLFRDAKPTRGIRVKGRDATGPQKLRPPDA